MHNRLSPHDDYDHIGESTYLIENIKVEKVIFNYGSFNDLELDLINKLKEKGIEYHTCMKELNLTNNKLYFLNTKEYENENDNSGVIYIKLNNYQFLFMGDASTLTEKEIISKYELSNIDLLKVGHHGSNTGSSKGFINVLNPKYSIISVGKNNKYGHHNKEILNILQYTKIYRTDIDGTIEFIIQKNKLNIEVYPP